MARDSVCMADDVNAPNLKTFTIDNWSAGDEIETFIFLGNIVGRYNNLVAGWSCNLNGVVISEGNKHLVSKVVVAAENKVYFSR